MSSSRKEIHAEKLKGVQNSFGFLEKEIANVANAGLDEDVASGITAGSDAIKSTASLTETMLSSFDSYLGTVAKAFEETDAKLAEQIGDPTPDTLKDIKEGDAYKKLMARDTSPKDTEVGSFRKLDEQTRSKK